MSAPQAVDCQRPGCAHEYTRHAPGGAHCRRSGCACPGFRWVALETSAEHQRYEPGELAQPGSYGPAVYDRGEAPAR